MPGSPDLPRDLFLRESRVNIQHRDVRYHNNVFVGGNGRTPKEGRSNRFASTFDFGGKGHAGRKGAGGGQAATYLHPNTLPGKITATTARKG